MIIARELARRGHDVAICARNEHELARAAQWIRDGLDVRVHTGVCDITDDRRVREFVAETESVLGPLDVVISVAGSIQVGPLEAMTRDHLDDAINTMLWGPINVSLAAVEGMRERGRGRIGVITSIGARISPPRLLPYSTAKFGAIGFTEGLAAELAGTGVTATAVVPWLMRTGSHLNATFFGAEDKQFSWFGPAASLPLLSQDAERAARWMVGAVLRGKPVANTSVFSALISRVHGLAPSTTVHLMRLVSRFLPRGTSSETVTGSQARERMSNRRVVDFLTKLGARAAVRFNQTNPSA